MHDVWVMLTALTQGEVIYDQESYILYRIHDENTVGVKNDHPNIFTKIRLAYLSIKRHKKINYRSLYAKELLKRFDILDSYDKDKLKKIAFYKDSFSNKVALITDKEIQQSSGERKMTFFLKALFNIV